MSERDAAQWLRNYRGRSLRLMEVCGTHTAALWRTGLKQLLPESVQLLSGPGCPVCVTASAYIDKLVQYALRPGYKVLSFGDMLQVPGSEMSLAQARAQGGQADFFYTPEAALQQARQHPELRFIVAAVGFETTAPVWGTLLLQARREGIRNLQFLTALKTMPQALEFLCRKGDIDGFLCPGHVAVVTGNGVFRKLAEQYGKTMVVGGFAPDLLLRAVARLVLETGRGRSGFWNEYPSAVQEDGNPYARQVLDQVFQSGDALWRGLGVLLGSGLYLRPEFQEWDAGSDCLTYDKLPAGCRCDRVLLGEIASHDCPCFGRTCTPEQPLGACMVSNEGSCCIAYREGGVGL